MCTLQRKRLFSIRGAKAHNQVLVVSVLDRVTLHYKIPELFVAVLDVADMCEEPREHIINEIQG